MSTTQKRKKFEEFLVAPSEGSIAATIGDDARRFTVEGVADRSEASEVGGFLWGKSLDDEILVHTATKSPWHESNTPRHVNLDLDHLLTYEDHFARAGWSCVGQWHSHPLSVEANPSQGDLTIWGREA